MNQAEFDSWIAKLKQDVQNGDTLAMKFLGDAYYQGASGKEKNIVAAFPYWKLAVDNGELSLAMKVAIAYYTGDCGTESDADALHYFVLAADYGNVDGQFYAGLLYENGSGCVANKEKAMYYYRKAALGGQGKAQYALARLLLLDRDTEGYHWLCCAHLSGEKKATEMINYMTRNGNLRDAFRHQIEQIKQNGIDPENSRITNSDSACYIATCVYGSYDCPQVWTLRRFRDNTLAKSWYGRLFIRTYYAVSPTLVKWFGHTAWFKKLWQTPLDRMVKQLNTTGVENTPYQDRIW